MKKAALFLLLGAAAGAVAVPGAAQETIRSVFGAYLSHVTEDRIDISVGVTRSGEPVRENRLVEFRDTVVVPEHYGVPFAASAVDGGTIVWYQDKEGGLRNVVLADAGKHLYYVKTNGSKLVAEIPKPR